MAQAARSVPTRSMRACAVVTATFIALRPRSCDVSSVAIAALPTHCCCRSFLSCRKEPSRSCGDSNCAMEAVPPSPSSPPGRLARRQPLAMSGSGRRAGALGKLERTSGVGLAAHGQWGKRFEGPNEQQPGMASPGAFMKINLPVTSTEREVGESNSIVSKTDLKGVITYANRDFVEISGFSESELLGHAHNIVRHPDMPQEAFEDLWRSLRAGRSWVGHVKNRCKNGDFYWVEAHISPLCENGVVVGYMSVRRRADRDTVAAVERHIGESRGQGRAEHSRGPVVRSGSRRLRFAVSATSGCAGRLP